jgi:hypothetical protein
VRSKGASREAVRAAEFLLEVNPVAGMRQKNPGSIDEIKLIGSPCGDVPLLHALNCPPTARPGKLVEASLGHLVALFVWRVGHSGCGLSFESYIALLRKWINPSV